MKSTLPENTTSLHTWFWPGVRITIVVLLIVGAFLVGNRCGYDSMNDRGYNKNYKMGDMSGRHEKMQKYSETNMKPQGQHDMMDMSMRDMGTMLAGKTGAELNRAFLEGMIPHHQGAVDMAKYLENSDKPELREMGRAIISAQNTEIEQMKQWMIDWGYIQTGSVESQTGMHMMPDGTMMHN